MTMVRGQYAQLMAPGIKHNFVEFLDLKHKDKQYDKVFNIDNTTQAFEDEVEHEVEQSAITVKVGKNSAARHSEICLLYNCFILISFF